MSKKLHVGLVQAAVPDRNMPGARGIDCTPSVSFISVACDSTRSVLSSVSQSERTMLWKRQQRHSGRWRSEAASPQMQSQSMHSTSFASAVAADAGDSAICAKTTSGLMTISELAS